MTATLLFSDVEIAPDQLRPRLLAVAGGLAALGVQPDDVVALVLRNEPAALEITLGCNLLGAYHCPLNFHFKAAELAYVLADSGAKAVFVHADLLPGLVDAVPSGCVAISVPPLVQTRRAFGIADAAGMAADAAIPVDRASGDDDGDRQGSAPAASTPPVLDYEHWLKRQAPWSGTPRTAPGRFAYTSGTTGRPKGVRRLRETMHPEQPQLLADVARETFGFGPEARVLLPAPFYHGAPNLYAIQAMQIADLLVLLPRFDAEGTLRAVEHNRITHLYVVPTMCARMLALSAEVRGRYDLSSLRFVISTGSPFPPDIKRAMIEWWGPVIREAYASSELGVTTLIDSTEWLQRPGSVGRAQGLAEICIVSDEGQELGPGQIGNIHARQPAYADFTYHRLHDARQGIDHRGLACVGDIGYLDSDGYLFITDRRSDMVISGGINIYPAEVEAALAGMPGVADCVAFGVPDSEYGEVLLAVVQTQASATLDERAVLDWLAPRLAAYKLPRRVEFSAQLPREDSGKVMKRLLRDPYWQGAGRRI